MKDKDYTSLFIEETTSKGYQVIWCNGTAKEAMDFLVKCPSHKRLELWSKAHADSPKGFAPMAWKDKDDKVMISTTFRMLCL